VKSCCASWGFVLFGKSHFAENHPRDREAVSELRCETLLSVVEIRSVRQKPVRRETHLLPLEAFSEIACEFNCPFLGFALFGNNILG
jgi:hypothetical protein